MACTAYFLGEGMRPSEIAELLDVDDRSVRRYRAEIAEKAAGERAGDDGRGFENADPVEQAGHDDSPFSRIRSIHDGRAPS